MGAVSPATPRPTASLPGAHATHDPIRIACRRAAQVSADAMRDNEREEEQGREPPTLLGYARRWLDAEEFPLGPQHSRPPSRPLPACPFFSCRAQAGRGREGLPRQECARRVRTHRSLPSACLKSSGPDTVARWHRSLHAHLPQATSSRSRPSRRLPTGRSRSAAGAPASRIEAVTS